MPIRAIAAALLLAFLSVSSASAQTRSQTDIAASFYEAFTGTIGSNGNVQSPSNEAGAIIEARHIVNPLVGYEIAYSFNRANESNNFSTVQSDAHEGSLDWVFSMPLLNFRPFVLVGAGVIYFRPTGGQFGTSSQLQAVYVYGGGIDWTFIPHFGLRLQYRGNLYRAPDLLVAASSANAFAHTAEPMFGAYFRF
jgi:hypothetical protein